MKSTSPCDEIPLDAHDETYIGWMVAIFAEKSRCCQEEVVAVLAEFLEADDDSDNPTLDRHWPMIKRCMERRKEEFPKIAKEVAELKRSVLGQKLN